MFKLIETTETTLDENVKKYRITLAVITNDQSGYKEHTIYTYTSDKSLEDARKAFSNVTRSLYKDLESLIG